MLSVHRNLSSLKPVLPSRPLSPPSKASICDGDITMSPSNCPLNSSAKSLGLRLFRRSTVNERKKNLINYIFFLLLLFSTYYFPACLVEHNFDLAASAQRWMPPRQKWKIQVILPSSLWKIHNNCFTAPIATMILYLRVQHKRVLCETNLINITSSIIMEVCDIILWLRYSIRFLFED